MSVRIFCGEISEFSLITGLHQGSALSSYLFELIIDELTTHIQRKVPWHMLFAYDIMLVDELRNDVNAKHNRWQKTLESKGFKISCKKIE